MGCLNARVEQTFFRACPSLRVAIFGTGEETLICSSSNIHLRSSMLVQADFQPTGFYEPLLT